jgi:hypothetical protein
VEACPDNADADLSAGLIIAFVNSKSRTAEKGDANQLERPVKIFGVLILARTAR